ncbi:MAG: glycoside hydrolase family 28 protein, partial [Prevotella sp.]|nr:glycoside hydrolase family 28 protein [Prevotella sp.]
MKKIQWLIAGLILMTGVQAMAQEMVKVAVPQKQQVGPSVMPKEIAPIQAPFEMRQLQKPVFPNRSLSIVKTGAKQKGMATKAIQKAIDQINKQGGGTVIVPEGEWKTGRIILKSNVNLRLEKDAVLSFSGQV